MSDDELSESSYGIETANLEQDDSPTERIPLSAVGAQTLPAHAEVIDPLLAASIRADYAQTVSDDDRIMFVAIVDKDGRIALPKQMRPGEEYVFQAQKVT